MTWGSARSMPPRDGHLQSALSICSNPENLYVTITAQNVLIGTQVGNYRLAAFVQYVWCDRVNKNVHVKGIIGVHKCCPRGSTVFSCYTLQVGQGAFHKNILPPETVTCRNKLGRLPLSVRLPRSANRPPIYLLVSPKQLTCSLKSPATSTKSVGRILQRGRNKSRYRLCLSQRELLFLWAYANTTNKDQRFSRLVLTRKEPSNGTACKRMPTRIQSDDAHWALVLNTTSTMNARKRIT